MENKGYLIYAFGDHFIDQAINLYKTIRKVGDTYPIAIVVHEKDQERIKALNLFEYVLSIDTNHELFHHTSTVHEKYGIVPTLLILEHTPFDKTIVIDTDVICVYKTDYVWSVFESKNQAVTTVGRKDNPEWHFHENKHLIKRHGMNFPETHTGIMFVDKLHHQVNEFFDLVKYSYLHYDELGFKKRFKGGKCQEINFSYASAKLNYIPLEFEEEPIMTFNYSHNAKIPDKIQTSDNVNKKLKDYIPFIHMFKSNINDYKKIIENLLK